MSDRTWAQLELTLPSLWAEEVGALMIEAGAQGVEEAPAATGTTLVKGVWGVPEEEAREGWERVEGRLAAMLGDASSSPACWVSVADDGWSEKWKEGFRPFGIGRRLWIVPSWEPQVAPSERLLLALDPGMAFGTGKHETTCMCLELTEELVEGSAGELTDLLDLGCGSGIISIAAALLGVPRIVGVDNDPLATDAATENAAINRVEDRCSFRLGTSADLTGTFDLIVANMLTVVLCELVEDLARLVAPGGTVVASGIYGDEQLAQLLSRAEEAGLVPVSTRCRERWYAVVLGRAEDGQ